MPSLSSCLTGLLKLKGPGVVCVLLKLFVALVWPKVLLKLKGALDAGLLKLNPVAGFC